jgi:hypothetical protein
MHVYNRRFAMIARRRRRLDLLGRTNRAKRYLASGFTLSRRDIRLIFKTVLQWGWLELKEGWRTWPQQLPVPVPVPVSVSVGKRPAIEPSGTVEQTVASASVSVSGENTSA